MHAFLFFHLTSWHQNPGWSHFLRCFRSSSLELETTKQQQQKKHSITPPLHTHTPRPKPSHYGVSTWWWWWPSTHESTNSTTKKKERDCFGPNDPNGPGRGHWIDTFCSILPMAFFFFLLLLLLLLFVLLLLLFYSSIVSNYETNQWFRIAFTTICDSTTVNNAATVREWESSTTTVSHENLFGIFHEYESSLL